MEEQIKQARLDTVERIITHAKRNVWCDFDNGNYFFVVSVQIFHNNHDIDYNDLVDFLKKYPIQEEVSCEVQSDLLYKYIALEYSSRDITIQISKDGKTDRGTYFEYNTTKPLQALSI